MSGSPSNSSNTSLSTPINTLKKVGPVLAAIGLVAVLATLLLRPQDEPDGVLTSLVDQPAPTFELPRFQSDERVTLAQFKNQPVVLNFWASWCVPCREELPMLEKVYQQKHTVLGILFNDPNQENITKLLKEYQISYPILEDDSDDIGLNYQITGLPMTFFVDESGVVRHIARGGLTSETFNEGLAKIGISKIDF